MKKLISFVVIISLLFSQSAQSHFFTDLLGGLFTIVSYPIQLILGSTKAPFFVSQNPFVEKEWHKEERAAAGRIPQIFTLSTLTPQAADNAQQEEQDTPPPTTTDPTPLPKTASPTPVPTPSIPAKKSVAPSASPTPAPSTPIESTQTSGEVRDDEGKEVKKYVWGFVIVAFVGAIYCGIYTLKMFDFFYGGVPPVPVLTVVQYPTGEVYHNYQ